MTKYVDNRGEIDTEQVAKHLTLGVFHSSDAREVIEALIKRVHALEEERDDTLFSPPEHDHSAYDCVDCDDIAIDAMETERAVWMAQIRSGELAWVDPS